MKYTYVCTAMGCEDAQNKFCGYGYACPFCGQGRMVMDEERTEDENLGSGDIDGN